MATGDLTVFDEAKLALLDGSHDLDTHTIKLAICDNTTVPAAGTTIPTLSDFTEVTAAGSYTAGGTTLTISLTEAAGTVTFDSTTNPTWAQNASNDTNAYWGILYNSSISPMKALAFIELGGPVDMTAGDLTVTFNASGIFTLA